jgi:hypothetical protein
MKLYLIIVISISCIAVNCNYTNEAASIKEILSKLNTSGKDWLNLWGYKQLNKDDIKKIETLSIVFSYSLDSSNVNEFFKIYSDSSHISYADIYSGSFSIDSSYNEIKFISEPESVLKLFYKGGLCELLHYGYTIVFHDVFWINESRFIIVGYEIGENNQSVPKVWFFDLNAKQYTYYALQVRKEISDTYLINKFNN